MDGEVDAVVPIVRELLSAIPAGCTWLRPIVGPTGAVTDFVIAAVGGQARDVAGRDGDERLGRQLSQLYPGMVGGPLWALYHRVYADGQPGELPDFRFETDVDGVVASSLFTVSVHRVCGGLMVWWQRLDEDQRRREQTELLGNLGWGETDLSTGVTTWSPGMYRIFERDPALGPISREEQAAAIVADDQPLRETAWQMLDSGLVSDLTIRVRIGSQVIHLRLLADTARDAAGQPVKIYGVVQDVTARENSRTAVERLSHELRTRELTVLAEHRLAGQLQQIIQPLPGEPFALADLAVWVKYMPAGNTVQVGGDWYHALALPDGRILFAIGDVVRHGLPAATAMAHLRYALIAWTSIGIGDPSRLLSHLNRLCLELGTTATAIIAVYDPPARALCWSRAGHPLPLLSRAGAVAPLARVDGMLLGASPTAGYPEARRELHPDDLLLFYTDGLVERRAETSDAATAAIAAALAAASRSGDGQPLVRLRDLLPAASRHDDTCLLAVHVLP